MKAFVINLKKDTERRFFMEKQLGTLHIPYEIVEATVGLNLSSKVRSALTDDTLAYAKNRYVLSDTQIACADSHRRVYEKIIAENLDWALVLEDDVQLNPNIMKVLTDDFIHNSTADWLQIDYVPINLDFFRSWIKASIKQTSSRWWFFIYAILKLPFLLVWGLYEYLREQLTPETHPSVALFPRPLYLASAYVITKSGVEKVLPFTTPIHFAADRVQNQARMMGGLRLRGVVPLLAKQARSQFASNLIYDRE